MAECLVNPEVERLILPWLLFGREAGNGEKWGLDFPPLDTYPLPEAVRNRPVFHPSLTIGAGSMTRLYRIDYDKFILGKRVTDSRMYMDLPVTPVLCYLSFDMLLNESKTWTLQQQISTHSLRRYDITNVSVTYQYSHPVAGGAEKILFHADMLGTSESRWIDA